MVTPVTPLNQQSREKAPMPGSLALHGMVDKTFPTVAHEAKYMTKSGEINTVKLSGLNDEAGRLEV
jgi:hypothetical protein